MQYGEGKPSGASRVLCTSHGLRIQSQRARYVVRPSLDADTGEEVLIQVAVVWLPGDIGQCQDLRNHANRGGMRAAVRRWSDNWWVSSAIDSRPNPPLRLPKSPGSGRVELTALHN